MQNQFVDYSTKTRQVVCHAAPEPKFRRKYRIFFIIQPPHYIYQAKNSREYCRYFLLLKFLQSGKLFLSCFSVFEKLGNHGSTKQSCYHLSITCLDNTGVCSFWFCKLKGDFQTWWVAPTRWLCQLPRYVPPSAAFLRLRVPSIWSSAAASLRLSVIRSSSAAWPSRSRQLPSSSTSVLPLSRSYPSKYLHPSCPSKYLHLLSKRQYFTYPFSHNLFSVHYDVSCFICSFVLVLFLHALFSAFRMHRYVYI